MSEGTEFQVSVTGWNADGESVESDGRGATEDVAIADARDRASIVEVGDVSVLRRPSFKNDALREAAARLGGTILVGQSGYGFRDDETGAFLSDGQPTPEDALRVAREYDDWSQLSEEEVRVGDTENGPHADDVPASARAEARERNAWNELSDGGRAKLARAEERETKRIVIPLYDHVTEEEVAEILDGLRSFGFSLEPRFEDDAR
jgi:hypothetical protein